MQKWVLYYRSIVLFDNIYVKSDVFKYDYYKQSNSPRKMLYSLHKYVVGS